MLRRTFSFLSIFVLLFACAASAQVSVTTQHNDLLRSGWNNRETKLTPSNVNQRQFGALFKVSVDDQIYAQPLVAANVTINGATHNVVYIATVNNTVYAVDGDNGSLYWSQNYTPASLRPPKVTDMTGACGGNGNYRDFSGNIGIVGTPVIDSAAQTIYFVARSTNGTNFYQYLHAVDIRTGAEKSGSPVLITASLPGAGDGNVNFVVSFDAQHNNQRQPLTLAKGLVFITFSSHCDWIPYHGWVLSYDKTTLQQKAAYNVTPDGYNGGIWESGGGPVVDGNNMYLVTGNGSIGSGSNQSDFRQRSESAVQLNISNSSAITVTDFYTPKNYDALEAADLDYGSMAAFLIPNSNLYLTGCKDGNLYLLDTANLGGFSTSANNVKQTISLGSNVTLRCQPSYYRSSANEYVYVWSENSQMKAYPVNRTAGNLDVSNLVTGSVPGPTGQNGAVISTSSNGNTDGTGIVWASYATSGDANQSIRPGILRAFNANDITQELWNSNQNATRDALGNYAKFCAPTVANGKVYTPTFSNQLVVYGIIDSSVQTTCSGNTNLSLNHPAYASSVEAGSNHTPSAAFDGSDTTRWASELYVDPQWIYVDLGKRDSICTVLLTWEVALGKDFQIQVSDDATNWTVVANFAGNTSFNNNISLNAAGRYVRMYGTARGSDFGYSLYDFQVYGKELVSCATPTGVTVNTIDTASAVIRWTKVSGAAGYNVQYKLSSSTQWTTLNTTADTLKLTGLTCGNYYNYRVQTVCSGSDTSSYSAFGSFNTISCANCGFLPTRIYSSDIGNVNVGGQACFTAPDTYRVQGSGKDIGSAADGFRFVYKTFTGNGTVQALVSKQDLVNKMNKAGVMFRASLDANSPNVFVGVTSVSGAVSQSRKTVNGQTSISTTSGIKAPYYVRIVKSGIKYTTYISANGTTWTQTGITTIPKMGQGTTPIYAGLAVTSHNNTRTSAATFNDFEITLDSASEAKEDYEGDFFVQKNVELQKLKDNLKLLVYPNPASRNFTMSFSIDKPQVVSVNILGLSDGKVYYQESLSSFSGSYQKNNATFKLANGSYIIFIKTSEGTVSKTLVLED